jgi:Holliday junction resolvase
MTRYETGRRFEYVTRDLMVSEGYWVTRAAGSKTKVDLICIKSGQIVLLQCKTDGKISPAERVSLLNLAALIDCAVPVLAYKEPGHAAVILAELTGPGPKDRRPFHTDEVTAA